MYATNYSQACNNNNYDCEPIELHEEGVYYIKLMQNNSSQVKHYF